MQNSYAADIGDFGKYGLLRWLCGVTTQGAALSLGVHWYRFDGRDEATNDGGFVGYLDGATETHRRLIQCDEPLAKSMRIVLAGERSIEAIEQSGVLQSSTLYFGSGLNFDDAPRPPLRIERRSDWNQAALTRLAGKDIAFFDPDNGLEIKSVPATRRMGPKYVFLDELLPYWGRGQSLVIYQHLARGSKHVIQIRNRAKQLRSALFGDQDKRDVIALRYGRGTARVFFVVPNPANPDVAQLLRNRIYDFTESAWVKGGHFTRVDC